MLTPNEKLLLLALDRESGQFMATVDMGLAAMTVVELAEAGRVAIQEEAVEVLDNSPTGQEPHDFVLGVVAGEPEPRSLEQWMMELANYPDELRGPVLASLVEKGIVKERHDKVLWVFDVARFPERDRGPEDELIARLRNVLLREADPEPHEALLTMLAASFCLDHLILPTKDERKQAAARLRRIIAGEFGGAVVARAIEACRDTTGDPITFVEG